MRAALVVEDGESPYVLAAVRSLARAGWRVGVAGAQRNRRLEASRYVAATHRVRLPEHDFTGFLDDVRDAVRTGRYELVFGADDIEVLALSAGRDRLGAVLPYAPHEAVVRAVDKLTLTAAAAAVGVPVPRTRIATAQALDDVRESVVVKPRLHWTPTAPASSRHLPAGTAPDRPAAHDLVRRIEAAGGTALLQDPVLGEQIALSVVLDPSGQLHAVSQQRTLASSLTGTSTRAVTTAVEPALLEGAVRLLRSLDWWGLANLQYLRGDDSTAHLIDLNGRFYGSLALAVAAGADLPAVWAGVAVGEPPSAVRRARSGVRFHAMHPDILRARAQRRGGLAADVVATVRYAPGAVHSTWSMADPRPAVTLAAELARGAVRRRVGGARG